MKKMLFIGMLTVAGALHLHAASSATEDTETQKIQDIEKEYQLKIEAVLPPESRKYSNFIIQNALQQNNTPEAAVEEAKEKLKQAQQNVNIFNTLSKNKEVISTMQQLLSITSSNDFYNPDFKPNKTTEENIKKLSEKLTTLIGKDNYRMQDFLRHMYITQTLKVSDKDIQAIQALEKELKGKLNSLMGSWAQ